MFICECGEVFNDDQDGAREHMLDQHLDLIETRFEEFLDDEEAFQDWTEDEIYDEAIEDVTDEMLDQIVDGE